MRSAENVPRNAVKRLPRRTCKIQTTTMTKRTKETLREMIKFANRDFFLL